MDELEKEDVIKVWDRTRSGIESFDRYIADIRRFYLTVLFAIVAVAPAFAKDQPASVIAGLEWVIGLVVVLFTIIFWGLDTYYNGFLQVAAATGRKLETALGLAGSYPGLTSELSAFAGRASTGRFMFHLMYWLPLGFASATVSIGVWDAFPEWRSAWPIVLAAAVLVVNVLIPYNFMRRAYDKVKAFLKERGLPEPS